MDEWMCVCGVRLRQAEVVRQPKSRFMCRQKNEGGDR